MSHVTLPVESHVLKYLLANQDEEHYFLSEGDLFGMYLLRLLIEAPVERRRDAEVAAYPGQWRVQLGSYAAWGLRAPTGKVAYLFNGYVYKLLLHDMRGFVQQAVEDGGQAKHALQAFMAKYELLEEDIQFETLLKSWQRYWSHRKSKGKRRVSLSGRLPLKELERTLLRTQEPATRRAA